MGEMTKLALENVVSGNIRCWPSWFV